MSAHDTSSQAIRDITPLPYGVVPAECSVVRAFAAGGKSAPAGSPYPSDADARRSVPELRSVSARTRPRSAAIAVGASLPAASKTFESKRHGAAHEPRPAKRHGMGSPPASVTFAPARSRRALVAGMRARVAASRSRQRGPRDAASA